MNHSFQDFLYSLALFGAGQQAFGAVDPQSFFHLSLDSIGIGGCQIDLVDHGNDGELVVASQVHISQCLGLHSLNRIHHQKGSLAGCQAPRNFIGEVDMARGVDQVQFVQALVSGPIVDAYRCHFDGDATFPLQVHLVQKLGSHLTCFDCSRSFKKSVGQGGFAVINMSDNAEITSGRFVGGAFVRGRHRWGDSPGEGESRTDSGAALRVKVEGL